MKRKDLSVTIALCVSLVVHATILLALAAVDVRELSRSLHHPAPELGALVARRAPAPDPRPAIAPAPVSVPDPIDYEELFGERGAKGKAANSSEGDQPMESRQGSQEQAALTPRPGAANAAAGGAGSSAPRPAAPGASAAASPALTPFGLPLDLSAPFGTPPAPPRPAMPPKPFEPPRQEAIAILAPGQAPSRVNSTVTSQDSPATRPVEQKPTSAPVTDAAKTQATAVSAESARVDQHAAATGPSPAASTRPTVALASAADGAHFADAASAAAPAPAGPAFHGPAGEPGNKSESESDPFSSRPTFTWHNGKLEARDGRKVKTVRPKLTDAGEVAVATLESPMVSFIVSIDDAGKVVGVDYLHHSGSNEIDLPAYRAMFEWEFEPSRDKRGLPIADAIIVTLHWQ